MTDKAFAARLAAITDTELKMEAHRFAEDEAVARHGTTSGPLAEDAYKRSYMAELTRLRSLAEDK